MTYAIMPAGPSGLAGISMNLITNAWAQGTSPAAAQPSGGLWQLVVIFVIFILFFYFVAIRPQSKRQKEHRKLIEGLAVGDEVLTQGGIVGRVARLNEQAIAVETAPGVEVTLQRQAVIAVYPKGTLKPV
jgi:preprotein translocase subunit YajC